MIWSKNLHIVAVLHLSLTKRRLPKGLLWLKQLAVIIHNWLEVYNKKVNKEPDLSLLTLVITG